jgi:hypothetical protein
MPVKPIPQFTAWSFSRWKDYCKCPFLAKCKHIDKLHEPANAAMERGTAIHTEAENYLKNNIKTVPKSLKTFGAEMRMLRKLGAVSEALWAFSSKWKLVEWYARDAWCRIKTDAYAVVPKSDEALVVDFKTGKPRDDHKDQLSLYAVGGFLVLPPEVESIDASMWYVDQGVETKETFLRENLLDMRKDWERKVAPMLNDRRFAARPGSHCSYCHQRKSNGGPCQF